MSKVVLVHGAWHGAWCWQDVVESLEAKGVEVEAIELPVTSHADDVAEARRAIEAAGAGAVVCGHSYGGLVISKAASGLPVGRLVYLTAFMTDRGEDALGVMQAHPSPMMTAMRTNTGNLTIDESRLHEVLYEDSPEERVAEIVPMLRPMPLGDDWEMRVEPAWKHAPSTYIVCTSDKALDPAAQRAMAVHADEVIEWPTDHSPFLTRPQELADVLASYT
jgi:pimeloyl-ACP methyl ester carboxylesterase